MEPIQIDDALKRLDDGDESFIKSLRGDSMQAA
jgi:hypothetical protein